MCALSALVLVLNQHYRELSLQPVVDTNRVSRQLVFTQELGANDRWLTGSSSKAAAVRQHAIGYNCCD